MSEIKSVSYRQAPADEERVALFLARLLVLSAGERARLKRKAGTPLAEAGDTLGLFYRLLPPGTPTYLEETFFLIASLFPLANDGGNGDLGAALRAARLRDSGPGLDRRVEILLDADRSQLGFRLRQTLRYLHSKEVDVNWQKLTEDILHWEAPGRFVQKRWARSYFALSATA